ncbi:MAG: hypothetical protein OEW36_13440 [Hylemonella sp.]|nr:hypothetical protein [Hylemonella sp.]
MFTVSSAAAQQIQQAVQESQAQDMALRVAARREPDGSIGYGMGFDEAAEGDTRLLLEDIAVVIAPQHMDLLEDTTLDFVELEPGQFNFIFVNQQPAFDGGAAGGCNTGGCGGCGTGCGSKAGGQ